MKITLDHKSSVACGDFGAASSKLTLGLEGRKTWLAFNRLRFETSAHNVDLLRLLYPKAAILDNRAGAGVAEAFAPDAALSQAVVPRFRLPPHDFQLKNFDRFKEMLVWAIFSEQGTGKTKVAIDIICFRYLIEMITGVIVLSSPKGVHAQWIEEQFPAHVWDGVSIASHIHGDKVPKWIGSATPGQLQVISGNIDMVKGKGAATLLTFAKFHGKRLLILIDESDSIKNQKSARQTELRKISVFTNQRAIMSGTPIAKDLTDEWSQFYFLDPDILGHKYLTTFRSQYCVMGGFENREVTGHKNVEQFKALTAPYIFRATKESLNLPPKVYDSIVFDMSAEQKRLMREVRGNFFSMFEDGVAVSVQNGAVAMLRAQQISCGFVVDENGNMRDLDNPRLDILLKARKKIERPVIIWCRFQEDVLRIKAEYPNAVTRYGPDTDAQRKEAKRAFLAGEASELIATPGASGKGVDGLQKVCRDAYYYSNSHNSIDRRQSEDRTHRMNMGGTSTYTDLIARGSVDRGILRNLKGKFDLSAMVLDAPLEAQPANLKTLNLDEIKNIMGEIGE